MTKQTTSELVAQEAPAAPVEYASPLDMPVAMFKGGLDRRGENRKALIAWIRESLVENVDFGSIKIGGRMSKPSLLKPGAEKICGMLGVTATFPTLADYEKAAVAGTAIDAIILRCEILDGHNRTVASGVGARSLSQDRGDLNKALKMAEKSAHIDATLRLAGLSEVFTQDIEDMKLADPKISPHDGEDMSEDERKAQHDKAVEAHKGSIQTIKDSLAIESLGPAAEAWFELDDDTKAALWLAPSKGGIFTTRERSIMKSKEFRVAHYGENAA